MQSINDITQVGPLWTTLIFYGIGYGLSKKQLWGWQVGVAVLLISHTISDDATLLGKFWAGAYVGGVLSQKVGLWYGVFGSMKLVRERLMNFSQKGIRQEAYQKQKAQYQPPPHQERQEQSNQYEQDFEAREKERYRQYQERQREARRAAQAAREAQTEAEEKAKASRASAQSKTKQKQTQSQERTKTSSQSSNQSQQKQQQKKTRTYTSSSNTKQLWYEVLGVSATATESQIKKARNRLLRKYHSDRLKNNPEITPEIAKLKTQEINEAFGKGIAKYRKN